MLIDFALRDDHSAAGQLHAVAATGGVSRWSMGAALHTTFIEFNFRLKIKSVPSPTPGFSQEFVLWPGQLRAELHHLYCFTAPQVHMLYFLGKNDGLGWSVGAGNMTLTFPRKPSSTRRLGTNFCRQIKPFWRVLGHFLMGRTWCIIV